MDAVGAYGQFAEQDSSIKWGAQASSPSIPQRTSPALASADRELLLLEERDSGA